MTAFPRPEAEFPRPGPCTVPPGLSKLPPAGWGSANKRGASMTYCLGIVLPAGLVLASDSRSNAGVDQVARVRKFDLFTLPGNRVIVILSAGNLATTQSVISALRETLGSGGA